MKELLKSFIRNYRLLFTVAEGTRRLINRVSVIGFNNQIQNKGVQLNVSYNIRGDHNQIEIRPGARLANVTIYIRGDHHRLVIERNCRLSGSTLWFEDHHGEIIVGENTSIEEAHLAVTEPYRRIQIGEDCMLSSGIQIRTGDSHSVIDCDTQERINPAEDVVLEDHVWVGFNACVLKGVTVHTHSIISTGAVVTSDVPDHSIAAGVPARVVKTNISWIRERLYSIPA